MGIELTGFDKSRGHLSKVISLNSDGSVTKDSSQCAMSEGKAYRIPFDDTADPAETLAEIISSRRPHQAITLGRLPAAIKKSTTITTAARESQCGIDGPIARTKKNITFATGERAWMLLDLDTKGAPPALKRALTEDGIETAIARVLPAVRTVSRVERASTSAGLYITATGEVVGESGGSHL